MRHANTGPDGNEEPDFRPGNNPNHPAGASPEDHPSPPHAQSREPSQAHQSHDPDRLDRLDQAAPLEPAPGSSRADAPPHALGAGRTAEHDAAHPQRPGQGIDHASAHIHGHGHGHGHEDTPDPVVNTARRTAQTLLLLIIVPVGVATALGVMLLWPDDKLPQNEQLDTVYSQPGEVRTGEITKIVTSKCTNGGGGDAGGDYEGTGAMPKQDLTCVKLNVRLHDGPHAGDVVSIDQPPESHRSGVTVGAEVEVMEIEVGEGADQQVSYAFIDFERKAPIGWLAAAYAIAVVAVARMRGLRALIGLGIAYLVLATFMIPGLLEGESPLWIALVGSSAIMFVVLYLAHGISARTSTALIGTLFGLFVTALLGVWATNAAHLTGMTEEDNFTLLQATDQLNLSEIVLCGLIIAGLGVLNDVTITQASAVWEMYELQPSMPAKRLFSGAMRIGRDHIASTVYTIAFAYAGAALPILMLLTVYERPMLTSITSGELAEEVVRTLVGSIGLVLAIPITTAVAVAVVKSVGSRSLRTARDQHGAPTADAIEADPYAGLAGAGATASPRSAGEEPPADVPSGSAPPAPNRPRRGGARRK